MKWATPVLAFLLLALPAAAEPELVQARLLADVAGVEPGGRFTVGVLFQIKPDWHIYWRNPGDSGMATAVEFVLPDGFQVGPLRWPLPRQFDQPGRIIGYGYQQAVLLTAEVTAPPTLAAADAVPIRAVASWLACEKVCVRGGAELVLTLPVGPAGAPADQALVARWQQRLPTDPERAGVTVQQQQSGNQYRLLLQWPHAPQQVAFFPAAESAVQVNDLSVQTEEKRTRIRFTAQTLPGRTAGPDRLTSVVAYTRPDGRRCGLNVAIRLNRP